MAIAPQVLAARHRMLAEIGEAGVAKLAASRVVLDPALSPLAAEVATSYLRGAGVIVEGAGEGADEPAAVAHLRGAHFALEAVARIVGARAGAPIPIDVLSAVITGQEAGADVR